MFKKTSQNRKKLEKRDFKFLLLDFNDILKPTNLQIVKELEEQSLIYIFILLVLPRIHAPTRE